MSNEKKCTECVYQGAKVDQSLCWACTNYDLFRKMDQPIVKPLELSSTNFDDVYQDIKKHFNYHDAPIIYRDRTLNEQFNDYLKSLEQYTAKGIFDNLEKFGVYDNGMYHFIIGAYAYQTIRKKYTGEPNQ